MTETAVIQLTAEIITHSAAAEFTAGMKIGRNKKIAIHVFENSIQRNGSNFIW